LELLFIYLSRVVFVVDSKQFIGFEIAALDDIDQFPNVPASNVVGIMKIVLDDHRPELFEAKDAIL